MAWPPRLAIGPFSTSARLVDVGCQTTLSNTRSSSSHSRFSRPRRRATLMLRRSLDPCSRPFALKLPIDRLPGSLWGSAACDRTAPEPAFPLARTGTSLIKVTHQNSLRGPPSGRIRPSNAGDRPEPTPKKVPHSQARSRSVSFSLGQRRIDTQSLHDIELSTSLHRSRFAARARIPEPTDISPGEPAGSCCCGYPCSITRNALYDQLCVRLNSCTQSIIADKIPFVKALFWRIRAE